MPAKAQPPVIAEHRANATVQDLREQGSETIRFTDKAKKWAGGLFGSSAGLGGSGALVLVTVYVIANLVVDLSYVWLDPRIRLE